MGIHNTNAKGVRALINSIGYDLQRSYLFAVEIPSAFRLNTPIPTMTVFCASTRVPDFKTTTKPLKFQKLDINLIDGVSFKPWDATFLSDENNIIRSNFLTWASTGWDINRKGAASPYSYKRNILVHQLDRMSQKIATYTLVGAYPASVGGYEIKNDAHDIVKFDVSFTYDYFTLETLEAPSNRSPSYNKIP